MFARGVVKAQEEPRTLWSIRLPDRLRQFLPLFEITLVLVRLDHVGLNFLLHVAVSLFWSIEPLNGRLAAWFPDEIILFLTASSR